MAQKYKRVEKNVGEIRRKIIFLHLFGKEVQSQKDIVHYNVLP